MKVCEINCMWALKDTSWSIQQLLAVCSVYDVEHDIKYNASKSAVKIFRTKEDKCLKCPDFKLSDINLNVCNKLKYLGHFITEQITDDEDVCTSKHSPTYV